MEPEDGFVLLGSFVFWKAEECKKDLHLFLLYHWRLNAWHLSAKILQKSAKNLSRLQNRRISYMWTEILGSNESNCLKIVSTLSSREISEKVPVFTSRFRLNNDLKLWLMLDLGTTCLVETEDQNWSRNWSQTDLAKQKRFSLLLFNTIKGNCFLVWILSSSAESSPWKETALKIILIQNLIYIAGNTITVKTTCV